MRHIRCLLPVLATCLLHAGAAAADITYSYGSIPLSPQGRLSGSFTATSAAIADGILTADELTANFSFADAGAPFAPAEFTAPEFENYLFTAFYGEIYVDRVSGAMYSGGFSWRAADTATAQTLYLSENFVRVFVTGSSETYTEARLPLTASGGGAGAGGGGPGGGPGENITYTYTTTTPAGTAGTLSGALVVPRAAITDGVIAFEDLISANFVLSGATAPFAPTTFTLADFRPFFLTPGQNLQVRVNPVSGAFLHDFQISAVAPGTNRTTLELFPHRYAVWPASSIPPSARGQGSFTVSGGGPAGGATAVELPVLHPLALIALGLLLILFVIRARAAAQR